MNPKPLTDNQPPQKRRRLRIVIPGYPAVNIYSGVVKKMTALGPVCVATAAGEVAGWDAEVIDENNYVRGAPRDARGLPDHGALQRMRPADAVGFYGGLTSTVPRLYALAKYYRDLGVTTIAGGQHFAEENVDEALRNGVDFVVTGEGEEVMKDLLAFFDGALSRKELRSVSYLEAGRVVRIPERPPLADFDALPLPDYSRVRFARIRIYPVGRVRGCGMNCEFCTVKGRPRYASPERLVEQIAYLYETFGARKFFLVDDLFGQDREETIRLCRMLAGYQLRVRKPFELTVQIRLDKARDGELLQAMREAGVRTVAIGYESPIPEELKAMNKRLKPEEMIAQTRLYHRAGLRVHGMFIFGYPMKEGGSFHMTAQERVRRFRRFIRKARIDTLQVLLPVPLPGTELRERLLRQNRVYPLEHIGWEFYDGNFPLFEPDSPLTAEEMERSIHRIMGRFYRLRHLFSIGFHIMLFPALLFYVHDLRAGWDRWSRQWWSSIFRFGGWLTLRRWLADFKKSRFSERLKRARGALASAHPDGEGADGSPPAQVV
ncbi:MAG: radical SAM protein [Planctomycetota bacterium]